MDAPDDSLLLANLAEEFAGQVREGRIPSIEVYAVRYPTLADRIRNLFPTLLLLEGIAANRPATDSQPPHRLTATPIESGEVFGDYRVRREIGRGGMGVVYEAEHVALGRRVALKVLLPLSFSKPELLERFLREARIAAGLHHTNIVPVFDVGQVRGTPYYAMQFIAGVTLDRLLSASSPVASPTTASPTSDRIAEPFDVPYRASPDGPEMPSNGAGGPVVSFTPPRLTPQLAAGYALQVAEALAYAHRRQVIHRDIKPTNILIDDQSVVWITDFGLARRLEDVAMTQPGEVLGTPRYMSPEQAESSRRPVDHRTDLYSLGVTLYELLTGRPAFDGRTTHEVITQILKKTPAAPRHFNASIPRDLEQVVMKAIAKRPEDRYATARELADDLGRFLRGAPVKARRISVIGQAWRWAKRNPTVASLIAAVVFVFALGAGVSAFFAWEAWKNAADARKNEATATDERNKALAADAKSRRNLYVARLNLAARAFREHEYERVSEILLDTLPGPGEEDLRGWEWHLLFRLVHPEVKGISIASSIDLATHRSPLVVQDRILTLNYSGSVLTVTSLDPATGRVQYAKAVPEAAEGSWVDASGDGRRLVFRQAEHIVVWDIEAAREVRRWPLAERFDISRVVLNYTGTQLAWPSSRPGAGEPDPQDPYEIIDTASGNLVVRLTVPPGGFGTPEWSRKVVFSPDGQRLGVRARNGRCVVWDTRSGEVLLNIAASRDEQATDLAFSPDSTRLAVVNAAGTGVDLYAFRPGAAQLVGEFRGPVPLASLGSFSPDGTKLTATGTVASVIVFDLTGSQPPQRFRVVGQPPGKVFFRPDGKRIYGFVFDLFLNRMEPRPWRPDRPFFRTSGGAIWEWDLTRPQSRFLDAGVRPAWGRVISDRVLCDPTGRRVLTIGRRPSEHGTPVEGLDLWDLDTGTTQRVWTSGPNTYIPHSSVAWSPDGMHFDAVLRYTLSPPGIINPLPLPPQGLAAGVATTELTWRDVLLVFDTSGKAERFECSTFGRSVGTSFSPDGQFVAVEDAVRLGVLKRATGQATVRLSIPSAAGNFYTAFTHDSTRLVTLSVSEDGIRWDYRRSDLATGETLARTASVPGVPKGPIWLTPDGGWLVARNDRRSGQIQQIKVVAWQLASDGLPSEGQQPFDFDSFGDWAHGLSPDGRWFAVGRESRGEVALFRTGTWIKERTLIGVSATVDDLRFTSDRAIVYQKGEVRVWELQTNRELVAIQNGDLQQIRDRDQPVSFNGIRYISASPDECGRVRVDILDGRPVPEEEIRERLRSRR